MAELLTCTPLFPAINEKELLEFFVIRIGHPPKEMIHACRKRKLFYDASGKLIRSKVSRIPPGCEPGSDSIRKFLRNEKNASLLDFIEVSWRAIYVGLEMPGVGPSEAADSCRSIKARVASDKIIGILAEQPGKVK